MISETLTPLGKPRCQEVHPVYQFQCERQAGHVGPCTGVIYWNEELD